MDRKSFSARWYAIVPATLATIAVAVPWLMSRVPEISFALQRGFALVCHQMPERSFYLFGGSVAVCARCLGVYLGAAAGLLIRVERRVALRFLAVAVVLSALDWFAELASLHGNWIFARFVLGILLGTSGAMLIAASFQQPLIQRWSGCSGCEGNQQWI